MPDRSVDLIVRAQDRVTASVRRMAERFKEMNAPVNRLRAAFRDLKRESNLGNVTAAMGRVSAAARRLAFHATAGLAAAAFGLRRLIDAGDTIGETAAKIGIGVEAFQRLTFAAEQEDVSQAQLTQGLKVFTKQLGLARAGQGSMAALMSKVTPKLLAQVKAASSSEQAFGLMADAIARIEDPTRRAALAQAAFGRSGIDLVNLLKVGSAAIAEHGREAEELGIVMSEDMVRAAGEADNQLRRVMAVVRGIGIQIGGALIPVVSELAGEFLTWVRASRESIQPRVTQFAKDLAVTFEHFVRLTAAALPPLVRFIEAIGGMRTVIAAVAAIFVGKLVFAVGALLFALGAISAPITGTIVAIAALGAAAAFLISRWEPVREFFGAIFDGVAEKFRSLFSLVERVAGFAGSLGVGSFAAAGPPVAAAIPGSRAPFPEGFLPGGTVSGQIGLNVNVNGPATARLSSFESSGEIDLHADLGPRGR